MSNFKGAAPDFYLDQFRLFMRNYASLIFRADRGNFKSYLLELKIFL